MTIKIKRISKSAKIPEYAHPGDAGFDVFSQEKKTIKPGCREVFSLGFCAEIPKNYVGLVRDKSGLALKAGITCLGGVIDSTYRGEWKIILFNTGKKSFSVKKRDKIAQVLILPVRSANFKVVEKLSNTKRADGGFGSSGN